MAVKIRNEIIVLLPLAALILAAGVFSFWHFDKNKPEVNISATKEVPKYDFLRSAYMDPASYDGLFDNSTKANPNNRIVGAVVPHHFLAKKQIARLYGQIKNENTELIYLISPDHFTNFFESGKNIYTSKLLWATPFGYLYANEKIIDTMIEAGHVSVSNAIVALDHGVTVEMPFIRYFFPKAKIVPLVLKNSSNYSEFFYLGQKIKEISPDGSVMVASSDFCHNLPADSVKSVDRKSVGLLKNLNINTLPAVNNDCRQCLALLAGYMGGEKYDFTLIDNTNSFKISGQEPDSVTSYVSGYFSK